MSDSPITVTPLGAAGYVTGSAYLVETPDARVLVDFGLFQGGRQAEQLNRLPRELKPRQLNAVLLTHAHLDHTGRLPLLARNAYAGPIFGTPATLELAGLILRDSAKVQAQDTERQNRRRLRAGEPPADPLYGLGDVETILRQLQPVPYHQPVPVAPNIEACFVEAGHMLGSASIQLIIRLPAETRRIAFSGDLGPRGAPILRDFEPFCQAHAVFLESTYGDRDHRPFRDTVTEFFDILKDAVERRGKVLVPTFAVGRAQVLTLLLAYAFRQKVVPPFPIYLDSPMAIEASQIYRHHEELFDDEMLEFLRAKPIDADLATFHTTATADESRKINDCTGPCLVMAGSGMCTAGRILHHFRNNLFKHETAVVIVGFQSEGSLGRLLVEGAKSVRIFGEKIAVKARIHTLGGFSAHAGQTDLLQWFDAMAPSRPQVFLVHGEAKGRQPLARLIQERYQLKPILPDLGQTLPI